MSTVSKQHIDQAWLGQLDAHRVARYYQQLAVRFQRRHRILTMIITAGALGTAGLEVSAASPAWIATVTSLVVGSVAVWSLLADYSEKSRQAATLEHDFQNLTLDWKRLWSQLSSLSDEAALERIETLRLKENNLTKHVSTRLPLSNKLNEQCADEAYAVTKAEYAS